MPRIENPTHYTRGAIAFHWIIALLIIFNLLSGLFAEDLGEVWKRLLIGLHKPLGILVLVLSFGRLAWRLAYHPPEPLAGHKGWERLLARTIHWSFYALMFLLPLSGWLMVSAGSRKYPISVFGAFDIPFLPVAQDQALGGFGHESHEILGYIGVALVVLHLLGVAKHHFIDKDLTLARMRHTRPGQA